MSAPLSEREILWRLARAHFQHSVVLSMTCCFGVISLLGKPGVVYCAALFFHIGWTLGAVISAAQRAATWESLGRLGTALEAHGWRRATDFDDVTAPVGRHWFTLQTPWPLMPPWVARAKELDRALRYEENLPWARAHGFKLSLWEWLRLVRWCRRSAHRAELDALQDIGGHVAVARLYLSERL